jgi:O-antigen/teichoic acid export membrane protein
MDPMPDPNYLGQRRTPRGRPIVGAFRSVAGVILLRASASLSLQAVSLLIGFLTTVLLAHLLSIPAYGRYTLGIAWAGLLAIPAILGLDRFVVRGIAVYYASAEFNLAKGLLRRANQLVLVASLVVSGAGCAIAFVFLRPPESWVLCAAMPLIPLTTLTFVRQAAMQAIGRVVTGQFPEFVLRPVLIIVTVGVLALAGNGALTAVTALAANGLGGAAALVLGAVLLRRALPAPIRDVRASYETRLWLRASLPMMVISGIWAANNYTTTVLVGALRGSAAAGVYGVVENGAQLIVLLLMAANLPLAPVIARMHATNDHASLERITERIAQATFFASLPVAIVLIAFPELYLAIFGPGFASGASALSLLAAGQLVNALAGPAGNVLLMTGHEREALGAIGLGLVTNVVAGLVLIPILGVTGGAAAATVSVVTWNVGLVLIARRRVHINATALPWLSLCGR